ncbi:hypothetical protein ACFWIB_38170 [Streptomyces sp. NPDC127051]|uniref:hypothetical protein n=1 Tax=Streptomyces sp. NPDC127051 TaxID=3347119 RepID=UPI0036693E1B
MPLHPAVEQMPAQSAAFVPGPAALRAGVAWSGLLRQSADGEIGFFHESFQDYLAALASVEADDLGLLVRRAHEDQWQNVVKMATGHARPLERGRLLTDLVRRGDREEAHRERLHGLAARCLPYATQLAPDVREMVIQRATGSGL